LRLLGWITAKKPAFAREGKGGLVETTGSKLLGCFGQSAGNRDYG